MSNAWTPRGDQSLVAVRAHSAAQKLLSGATYDTQHGQALSRHH